MPAGGSVEDAVVVAHHAIAQGSLQRFHSTIDTGSGGIEAVLHVDSHACCQGGKGNGQALCFRPAVAVIRQVVLPVEAGSGQHILDNIVVGLPTVQGIDEGFRVAIVSHHLLNAGRNTSRKAAFLADGAVLVGPERAEQVVRFLLITNGVQQGADGCPHLTAYPSAEMTRFGS